MRGSETDAGPGRQRLQRRPGACAARDMRVGFHLRHYEEWCGAGDGCFEIWSGEDETESTTPVCEMSARPTVSRQLQDQMPGLEGESMGERH